MNALQHKIPSGLNDKTTADEVMWNVSLAGRTAIITGGYAGIGRETVRVFVKAGATVIVGARDLDKARKNLAEFPSVQIRPLDLIDPASIDQFANAYVAGGRALHLLINNAGIMGTPLTRDRRGYEAQFATNHLGHFQLTARLWPALVQAGGARVINLSSRGHRSSPVVFEDPNFEHREYERWKGYGQSKTANVLFSLELDRRGQSQGVRSFAVHPGVILDTDLARHLAPADLTAFGIILENGKARPDPNNQVMTFKSLAQGAATTCWCAVSPQLDGLGGVYCEDCDIADPTVQEGTTALGVRAWAVDPEAAKKLWTLSEQMTGVPFPAGAA